MTINRNAKKKSKNSLEYWHDREENNKRSNLLKEKEYLREIVRIHQITQREIQKEINYFYTKYSLENGITYQEARKRASKLDIEAYSQKAKKYVKEKNFSKRANEEMALYNMTMKVNRLELLKANLALETIAMNNELEQTYKEWLEQRSIDEFKRQAGILGETNTNTRKNAHAIVNASFKNATYSDRIWSNNAILVGMLNKELQTMLIMGEHPNKHVSRFAKVFDTTTANAKRLLITELARVQTETQKQSFERNGYEYYTFLANPGCCPICKEMNDKTIKVKDMQVGLNAPPMHPYCRCSTSAAVDDGTPTNLKNDEQYYRKVTIDKSNTTQYYKPSGGKFNADKITSINEEYYISRGLKIKPKQLSKIYKTIEDSMLKMEAKEDKNRPKVILCKTSEIKNNALVSYGVIDNMLKINAEAPELKNNNNLKLTAIHELYHWKDAQEYAKKYGNITQKNLQSYFNDLNNIALKKLEKIQKNGIIVEDISNYARISYHDKKYNETYTEWRAYRKEGLI